MPAPKITVCIPVFHSERYLFKCLSSVMGQEFVAEIIVINDASEPEDRKMSCRKIVKAAQKLNKKNKIKYLENSENLGPLESRRLALFAATGEYVFFLDADDFLAENALAVMHKKITESNADIVNCSSVSFVEKDGEITPVADKEKFAFLGILEGPEILEGSLTQKAFSFQIWGKLFKKEVILNAFEHIPFVKIYMGETTLLHFFTCLEAKKYVGIEEKLYYYRTDSGITACKSIKSLEEWKKFCTSASIYTIIYAWLQENNEQFSDGIKEKIKHSALQYLYSSLTLLNKVVPTDLYVPARELLCEYWGIGLVEHVEEFYQNQQ